MYYQHSFSFSTWYCGKVKGNALGYHEKEMRSQKSDLLWSLQKKNGDYIKNILSLDYFLCWWEIIQKCHLLNTIKIFFLQNHPKHHYVFLNKTSWILEGGSMAYAKMHCTENQETCVPYHLSTMYTLFAKPSEL